MDPVLKWAGAKRWLVPGLRDVYAAHRHRRLVEPFVGSMAVALGLEPERALLCDANAHLINFHRRLRDPAPFSISMLNDERFYYAQRDVFNALAAFRGPHTVEGAEIFAYLNRTCFNGLCRFNRDGKFNVPFGKYAAINYRRDFAEYAPLVRRWEIQPYSFEGTFAGLLPDDFVYLDPPFDGTFTDYNDGGFTWQEQVRLAELAARHPGPVVASNSATDRVLDLYRAAGFSVDVVEVKRSIAASGNRIPAKEMLAVKNIDSKEVCKANCLGI